MVVPRVVIALLVVHGVAACGRLGFEALDGGGTTDGDAAPDAVVVTPIGRARAISTGRGSAMCAILDDGSLWCWGDTRDGSFPSAPPVPFTLPMQIGSGTDWQTIEVGGGNGCGLRAPGTLWCWGANQQGGVGTGTTQPVVEPVQIGTSSTWLAVSSGFAFTCALASDGGVWCWGANDQGQLGDNTMVARSSPQPVPGLSAIQISVGDSHVCAVDAAGALRCWGSNSAGKLGDGTTLNALVPRRVAGTWQRVDAAVDNTTAIASDGSLWAWGNATGSSPVQRDARTDWDEIATTLYGFCATRAAGELWCRGGGNYGVTGPTLTTNNTLTQIAPASRFDTIAVSPVVACANRDQQLECIGGGFDGQLGDLAARFDRSPRQLPGLWSALSSSDFASCGIAQDGMAACWGSIASIPSEIRPQVPTLLELPPVVSLAQSGGAGVAVAASGALWHWGAHTTDAGATDYIVPPAALDATTTWIDAAIGEGFKAAVRSDGSLWTWGRNPFGQLGDGTTMARGSPTMIGTGYSEVSLGYQHGCARRTDGTLRCWGANGSGELGDGTTTQRLTPVASAAGTWSQVDAGLFGTLAIRTDGTLWGWGSNGSGRLGLGAMTGTTVPVQVGTATWSVVDAHKYTTCGIQTDRTLWCWGENDDGQHGGVIGPATNVPTKVGTDADWAEVAVGQYHACARKITGAAWCWGSNFFGLRGDGLAWRASYGPVARP